MGNSEPDTCCAQQLFGEEAMYASPLARVATGRACRGGAAVHRLADLHAGIAGRSALGATMKFGARAHGKLTFGRRAVNLNINFARDRAQAKRKYGTSHLL